MDWNQNGRNASIFGKFVEDIRASHSINVPVNRSVEPNTYLVINPAAMHFP
jgi:hypothetical protein